MVTAGPKPIGDPSVDHAPVFAAQSSAVCSCPIRTRGASLTTLGMFRRLSCASYWSSFSSWKKSHLFSTTMTFSFPRPANPTFTVSVCNLAGGVLPLWFESHPDTSRQRLNVSPLPNHRGVIPALRRTCLGRKPGLKIKVSRSRSRSSNVGREGDGGEPN